MGLKLKNITKIGMKKKKKDKDDCGRSSEDNNNKSTDDELKKLQQQHQQDPQPPKPEDDEHDKMVTGRFPVKDADDYGDAAPITPSRRGMTVRRAKSRRQLREESKRALDAELLTSSRHNRSTHSLYSMDNLDSDTESNDDGVAAVISIPKSSTHSNEDGRKATGRTRSSSRSRPTSMRNFDNGSGNVERSAHRSRSKDRPMSLRNFDSSSTDANDDGKAKRGRRDRSLTRTKSGEGRSKSIDAAVRRREERQKKKEIKATSSRDTKESNDSLKEEKHGRADGISDKEDEATSNSNELVTNKIPLNDSISQAKGDGDHRESERQINRQGRRGKSKDRLDGSSTHEQKSKESKSKESRSRSSDRHRTRSRSRGSTCESSKTGTSSDHKHRPRSRSNERRKKRNNNDVDGDIATGETMRLLYGATEKTDADTVVAGNKEEHQAPAKIELTPLALNLMGVEKKGMDKQESTFVEGTEESPTHRTPPQREATPEKGSKEERRARRAKEREMRRSSSGERRQSRRQTGSNELEESEKSALVRRRSGSKELDVSEISEKSAGAGKKHSKEGSIRRSSRTLNVSEHGDRRSSSKERSVLNSSRSLSAGDRPSSKERSVRRSSRTLNSDRPPQAPARSRSEYSATTNISASDHGIQHTLRPSRSSSRSDGEKGLRHSAHGDNNKAKASVKHHKTHEKSRDKPDAQTEKQRQVVSVVFHKEENTDDEKEKGQPNTSISPLVALLCHGDLHQTDAKLDEKESTSPSVSTDHCNGKVTEDSKKNVTSEIRTDDKKENKFNADDNMAVLLGLVGASEKDFEPTQGQDSSAAVVLFDTRPQSSVEFFTSFRSPTPATVQKTDMRNSPHDDDGRLPGDADTKSKKKHMQKNQKESIEEEQGGDAKDLFDLIDKSQDENIVSVSKKAKTKKIRRAKCDPQVDDEDAEKSLAPPSLAGETAYNSKIQGAKKKQLQAVTENEGDEDDEEEIIDEPMSTIPSKAKSCTHLVLEDDDDCDSSFDDNKPIADPNGEKKKKKRSSLANQMKKASTSTSKVVSKKSKEVMKKATSARNIFGQVATKTFARGKEEGRGLLKTAD